MKTCRTCNIEKPINEYYKHKEMSDGYLNICKECIKSNVRARRVLSPEKVRAYDNERSKKPNRIRSKNERTKRRRAEVSGYMAAHNKIARKMASGGIVRPEHCSYCGNNGRIEAHHSDYKQPLVITWLCAACHRRLHAGKTAIAQDLQRAIGKPF